MSKTYLHKFRGKFRNGIDDDNIPIILQNYFDRKNNDVGKWRRISKSRKYVGGAMDANEEIGSNTTKKMVDKEKSKFSKLYV